MRFPVFPICITLLSLQLAGCSTLLTPTTEKQDNLTTLHQYQLHQSQSKQVISLTQVAQELQDADVIFIGEYHSHSASHLLQAQLLSALYQRQPNLILSMEQFSRDKQEVVNQYLNAEIGEQTLIKQGDAWNNYASDYRPLVEFAKAHSLPVIAANAPIAVVRCVAIDGPDAPNKFRSQAQSWVAADIKSSSKAYQDKFSQAMGSHGSKNQKTTSSKLSNSFYAQLSRDNTMAESIYQALQAKPNSQVIHTNGAFHSDYHLGTVDALQRLAPELKIAVISPQFNNEATDWQRGDFIYHIQPMPTRYIKDENRNAAIKKMMAKRKDRQCKLY